MHWSLKNILLSVLAFIICGGVGWYGRKIFTAHQNDVSKTTAHSIRSRDGKDSRAPVLNGNKEKAGDFESSTLSDAERRKGVHQTAKEMFQRILSEVENSSSERVDATKLWARLVQLQDFGEEGTQVIREFLQTNQDIILSDNRILNVNTGERGVSFLVFREALLETLYEMNNPISQTASLEVLKTTSLGGEVFLATRNLEKFSPGTYRQEAIQATAAILADIPAMLASIPPKLLKGENIPAFEQAPYQGELAKIAAAMSTFQIAGYYQAQELIPQMESVMKEYPRAIINCMQSLHKTPVEFQVELYRQLVNDEKSRKELMKGWSYMAGIVRMDFQNDSFRQLVSENLVKETDSNRKRNLIKQIGQGGSTAGSLGFVRKISSEDNFKTQSQKDKANQNKISGLLKLLDDLEPQMDSPDLKIELNQARKILTGNLKDPPAVWGPE